jgi:hypothetical protein
MEVQSCSKEIEAGATQAVAASNVVYLALYRRRLCGHPRMRVVGHRRSSKLSPRGPSAGRRSGDTCRRGARVRSSVQQRR